MDNQISTKDLEIIRNSIQSHMKIRINELNKSQKISKTDLLHHFGFNNKI